MYAINSQGSSKMETGQFWDFSSASEIALKDMGKTDQH